MKKKSIMSGIDKVISYRMIYPLQHLSLLIMAILLLPLCSVETKAESYYIISPNAKNLSSYNMWGYDYLNEWMKMTPVEGSNTKFTILLRACYPTGLQEEKWVKNDGSKFQYTDDNVKDYLNAVMFKPGFQFAVASKTEIENCANECANDFKDIGDFKKNFLYPDMEGYKDSNMVNFKKDGEPYYNVGAGNYWVYKKNVSGTLVTNPKKIRAWEIRRPFKTGEVEVNGANFSKYNLTINNLQQDEVYLGKEDNTQNVDLCHVNFPLNERLDGVYKFTIDVSNMTWTMEYDPDTKVSYLAVIPGESQNSNINTYHFQYQTLTTYFLTQKRDKKTGRFPNVYSNPSIYLQGKNTLMFFGCENNTNNNNP